jgi:hypothetical protein
MAASAKQPAPKMHECYICGKQGPWEEGWMSYGSIELDEEGAPALVTCSVECRDKVKLLGGPDVVLQAVWTDRGYTRPPRRRRRGY